MRSWLLALLTALLMPATAAAQVIEYYHLDALGGDVPVAVEKRA